MDIADFSTEGLTESGNDHDYLLIESSHSTTKLYGSSFPHRPDIVSQEEVVLTLVTDEANQMRGFFIRFLSKALSTLQ